MYTPTPKTLISSVVSFVKILLDIKSGIFSSFYELGAHKEEFSKI